MPTLIHQRVREAREGSNPKVICRVNSGWVVMGDVQFVRGYALLLPDPVAPGLNSLSQGQRKAFLHEMTLIGDALLDATGACRVNYEILGNLDPALHAHVFPRYDDEPEELRTKPVWFYDWAGAPPFDAERDRALMQQVRAYLTTAGACV